MKRQSGIHVEQKSLCIHHIDGARFGSSGATVVVNGKDVSSFITAQADTQITLRGKNKKLNLKKGTNQIVVTVDGRPSNTYVLTL